MHNRLIEQQITTPHAVGDQLVNPPISHNRSILSGNRLAIAASSIIAAAAPGIGNRLVDNAWADASGAPDVQCATPQTTCVWNLFPPAIQQANAQEASEDPNASRNGPSSDLMEKIVHDSSQQIASGDPITKVQIIAPTKKNHKYRLKVTQQNSRSEINIADYYDPSNVDHPYVKLVSLAIDNDLLAKKTVSITPESQTSSKHFKKIGRTLHPANWDNLTADNSMRFSVDGQYKHDPNHVSTVNIPITRKIAKAAKAGRLFFDVTEQCTIRDASYDPNSEGCAKIEGAAYRALPRKSSSYYAHLVTSPKNVVYHSKQRS